MEREKWPERITAIKSVTYDVESIYQNLLSDNRAEDGELEITFDDVMNMIEIYVLDDLSCGWGHPISLKDIVFKDENDEEY